MNLFDALHYLIGRLAIGGNGRCQNENCFDRPLLGIFAGADVTSAIVIIATDTKSTL